MTGQFDFSTAPERRGSDSIKWGRFARPDRDILPLWVADMDWPCCPEILDAISKRNDHGVLGYAHAPDSCLEAVRTYLREHHQLDVPGKHIIWLPGMVPGLSVSCRAVGEPGDGVAFFTPIYPPFFKAPADGGKTAQPCPLKVEEPTGRYTIDVEALERTLTPDTRMLMLCNPHNPVGRAFTADELAPVLALCAERDIVLCSDEIHCDLILDEEQYPHHCAHHHEGENGLRTITLMAPSKTYNIAGLGLSFAIIPDPQLRGTFKKAMGGFVPHPSPFAYAAGEAAYRHGEPWRKELLQTLRSHRDHLQASFGHGDFADLRMHPMEATYLAWIDARNLPVKDPHAFFLDKADIAFSPGPDFGQPGYIRLNFGCPRSLLDQAFERMQNALASLTV